MPADSGRRCASRGALISWVTWTVRTPGRGTGPRPPVVVTQGNPLNLSRLATAVSALRARNVKWADGPGNVLPAARITGLPRESVANVSQVVFRRDAGHASVGASVTLRHPMAGFARLLALGTVAIADDDG